MNFSIQYPLADLRPISDLQSFLLRKPSWSSAMRKNRHFVHKFGTIKRRNNGGLLLLGGGEDKICEARRAIRFTKSPLFQDKPSGLSINLKSFRRFFYDNKLLAKFELLLCNVLDKRKPTFFPPLQLDEDKTTKLIKHFLSLHLFIPNVYNKALGTYPLKEHPILEMGYPLSCLYNYATIKKGTSQENTQTLLRCIKYGDPIIILEIEANENIDVPFPAHRVEILNRLNIQLSYYRYCYPQKGPSYIFYIIKRLAGVNNEHARYLRLYLWRLNAIYSCFIYALENVLNIQNMPNDKLEYLNGYIDNVNGEVAKIVKNTDKYWHTNLVSAVKNVITDANAGSLSTILPQLDTIKEIHSKRSNKIDNILNMII
ncbi:MAG: hypothetical protein HKK66_05535 [Chlorobiaceae bacterium]|nr:hypothetical protein [Chlorobiaceae bacterium]